MTTDQTKLGDARTVAKLAGITKSALEKMRRKNPSQSPPYFWFGGRVYYPLSGPNSLESWIADRASDPQKGRS